MKHLLSVRIYLAAGTFWLFLSASNARAIDIPDVQMAALDQPQINMILRRTPSGDPLSYDFAGSTYMSIQAYYDTGASGILLSKETTDYLGISHSTHSGSMVVYSDIGVGGTDDFHVSEPLYASLAAFDAGLDTSDPSVFTQQISGTVRTQIGLTSATFGADPIDVVGMPAMLDKVVVMDPTAVNDFVYFLSDPGWETMPEDWNIHTYVYDPGTPYNPAELKTNPGIPTTNRHVDLSYGDFSRFTTVTPSGSEGPTLTHNPLIGPDPVATMEGSTGDDTPAITISKNGQSTSGSFLLDTGAAASMISSDLASDLGIRYENGSPDEENPVLEIYNSDIGDYEALENQFQLTLTGIGGSAIAAGFYLDSLLLPTIEAGNPLDPNDLNNLNFTGAPVLVWDITLMDPNTSDMLTLDGIFGMNYMVASTEIVGGSFGLLSTGVFDWIVFDENAGILGLNLDMGTVPEPSALVLLTIGAALLLLQRLARRRQ